MTSIGCSNSYLFGTGASGMGVGRRSNQGHLVKVATCHFMIPMRNMLNINILLWILGRVDDGLYAFPIDLCNRDECTRQNLVEVDCRRQNEVRVPNNKVNLYRVDRA